MEKSGYLNKLGDRTKSLKRRWFVVKEGAMSYYKSQASPPANQRENRVI